MACIDLILDRRIKEKSYFTTHESWSRALRDSSVPRFVSFLSRFVFGFLGGGHIVGSAVFNERLARVLWLAGHSSDRPDLAIELIISGTT